MDKEQIYMTMVTMIGAVAVLLIPTSLGIIWKIYSDSKRATEANTMAINTLSTKLEIIWAMTLELPKIKKDIDAAHERIRNTIGKNANE